jgi:DNA-binding NtrC family response regulator
MTGGAFRSDLFYRLSVHQVEVPPLRERKEDIPMLLGYFIEEAATALEKNTPGVPEELLMLLASYHFPGNVRELRAMAYDAVARHQSGRTLSMSSFRKAIKAQRQGSAAKQGESEGAHAGSSTGRFPTLKEAEEQHIQAALRLASGNQGIAATLLGISRPALNRRLAHMNK